MILLLLLTLPTADASQSAFFSLSPAGYQYQPVNIIETLSNLQDIPTVLRCAILCFNHFQCRTFDFDTSSGICHLYQGSVDTGSLMATSLTSIVGWIQIDPSQYQLYNASYQQCADHRFLLSNAVSGRCQCPSQTFWNGSICVNQRFLGQSCLNDNWCRNDLTLFCNGSICVENVALGSTTTVSSTTVTVSLPCPATLSSNGILYSVVNPTTSMRNYTCFARNWFATSNISTLSFTFRHDPGYWSLDDVNVYQGITPLIINGGFENGMTAWNLTGSCDSNYGDVFQSVNGSRSGSYYYGDGCVNGTDTLRQRFPTIPGSLYVINFWLASSTNGSVVIANITIE